MTNIKATTNASLLDPEIEHKDEKEGLRLQQEWKDYVEQKRQAYAKVADLNIIDQFLELSKMDRQGSDDIRAGNRPSYRPLVSRNLPIITIPLTNADIIDLAASLIFNLPMLNLEQKVTIPKTPDDWSRFYQNIPNENISLVIEANLNENRYDWSQWTDPTSGYDAIHVFRLEPRLWLLDLALEDLLDEAKVITKPDDIQPYLANRFLDSIRTHPHNTNLPNEHFEELSYIYRAYPDFPFAQFVGETKYEPVKETDEKVVKATTYYVNDRAVHSVRYLVDGQPNGKETIYSYDNNYALMVIPWFYGRKHGVEERWFFAIDPITGRATPSTEPLLKYYWLEDRRVTEEDYKRYYLNIVTTNSLNLKDLGNIVTQYSGYNS